VAVTLWSLHKTFATGGKIAHELWRANCQAFKIDDVEVGFVAGSQ
jgi:hypothetical protein